MTELAGTIVVSRPRSATRDLMRAYVITVDGSPAGKVRLGAKITIDAAPGAHRVQARVDWTGSPELEVHVEAGSTLQLVVEPAGSAFEFWQLFGTTHWLHLGHA